MKRNYFMKVFTLLILCVAFIGCGGSNSPAEIEMSILKQVKNKNYEKAIDMWVENANWKEGTDISAKKNEMKPLAAKAKQSAEEGKGIKDLELLEETISEDGNSAKVKILITYTDGTSKDETSSYVKVDGKWKINVSSNK